MFKERGFGLGRPPFSFGFGRGGLTLPCFFSFSLNVRFDHNQPACAGRERSPGNRPFNGGYLLLPGRNDSDTDPAESGA